MIFLRLSRHLASIVTLFLVFASGAFAQPQPPSQPPTPSAPNRSETQQQQRQEERGSSNTQGQAPGALAPTVGQPVVTQQRETPQTEGNAERSNSTWQWGTVPDWGVVAFTAVLTVFTFIQLRQNRLTRLMAQRLERARIAIEKPQPEKRPNGTVYVLFDLSNKGRSVAYGTRMATELYIAPALPTPIYQPEWKPTVGIIQAGEPMSFEIALPKNYADVIASGQLMWIVGRLEYRDVFDATHVRGYAFGFNGKQFFPPEPDPGYNYET